MFSTLASIRLSLHWLHIVMALLLAALPARQAAAAYAIGAEVTGSYYDPARSGEGFFIEHITSDGKAALLVTWFTYLDGQQRWLIGVGPADHDEARIPLDITDGARFPPQFRSGDVRLRRWGELVLRFRDADHVEARWTSSFSGFGNGSVQVERLSRPTAAYEPAGGQLASCHTGAWYSPEQGGHGMLVEVLQQGPQRELLVVWYVYGADGQQRWIIGQGPISGAGATMPAQITSGTGFGTAFDPAAVQRQAWGTLEFIVVDADHARWRWRSTQPGFGEGELDLIRLTATSGRDCGPLPESSAARFLTQASYGPNAASVAEVRSLGYAGWLARQGELPATLHRPAVEQVVISRGIMQAQNMRNHRMDRWYWAATNAPDQLRQRMAFALSQIFVVSDLELDTKVFEVAEFYDVLVRNALGNYRDLLRDVARSPAMAEYLTFLRNKRTEWTLDAGGRLVPSASAPDENFAREVMQLFSIGLFDLRRDHSPILDANGAPRPTYAQDLVTQTARVMTGLGWQCTGPVTYAGTTLDHACGGCSGVACQFSDAAFFSFVPRVVSGTVSTALVHPDAYRPLVCYPRWNDNGRSTTPANAYAVLPPPHDRKPLLAGLTIGASPLPCHTLSPQADQASCTHYCDQQLDDTLDALFRHPNTAPFVSRQLIQRFTTSNPSPGYIDRVAAVFEDDGQGVRGNLHAVATAILLDPEARTAAPAPDFGKLREPLLRLTALWRAFDVRAGTVFGQSFGLEFPDDYFKQRPLGAPSVFNFYEPDYLPPGVVGSAGLKAPEFQILDEFSFVATADLFNRLVNNGWVTRNGQTTTQGVGNSTMLPVAAIDGLPADPVALVETLNQKLLYGRMGSTMRERLVAYAQGPLGNQDARRKALDLIQLIVISPAFAAQP